MMNRELDVSLSVSDDEVRQFGAIWQQVFHEELSHAEARTIAARLLALYSLLAKPLPEQTEPASPSEDTGGLKASQSTPH